MSSTLLLVLQSRNTAQPRQRFVISILTTERLDDVTPFDLVTIVCLLQKFESLSNGPRFIRYQTAVCRIGLISLLLYILLAKNQWARNRRHPRKLCHGIDFHGI